MGSRKLVRDALFAKQQLRVLHHYRQAAGRRRPDEARGLRAFGVFHEFSKQIKGEAKSDEQLQQSIKELNEKVRARTKVTAEKLYKRVDGLWAEAEATTKKAKETLGLGEKDSSARSEDFAGDARGGARTTGEAQDSQGSSLFGRLKGAVSSASPAISSAFQKLRETRAVDLARKGYEAVKEELAGSSASRRRRTQSRSSASKPEETSLRRDLVIVPSRQSRLGKKWEAFKEKMRGHPMFKRVSGLGEPIVAKGQELAEDVRERWETSDHPVVHKIQDLNDTVFGETSTALSFKEIRRRDPYFSLPDFVADVQEMIRPTLSAYLKGDVEQLAGSCCKEVIERCKGERAAYEAQGVFFDSKILHISDVDVRETKMMGSSPIIIVAFQTQQIYCVRDRQGSITAGGKDTIQTVYYAWAMQLVDAEELGEEAVHPTWRLREMQQLNVQALI